MSEKSSDYCKVPTNEILNSLERTVPSHYGCGVRHIQFVIFLLCMTVAFIARSHLGVTIVAMTNISQKNVTNETLINVTEQIDTNSIFSEAEFIGISETDELNNNTEAENSTSKHEVYDWDMSIQEMVLGAFFTGYCIGMVPSGILSQRCGGKISFQFSLLINGITSIVTPWLVEWGGWKAVCGCRFLQGISQSGTYPSIQSLLSKWVPANELGAFTSYIYTGTTLGTVIGFQLGGFLAESRWGWPTTFWVVGILCILCSIIMTIFGAASPNDHKSISEEEKMFIFGDRSDKLIKRNKKVPWKSIITSKPIWATYVSNISSGCTFIFFLTQVPSYIHYILGNDVMKSGLLSSLPYIASLFTSVGFGILSDYLTNNNILSTKTARRISNSFSQVGISLSLFMSTVVTSTELVVTCLVIAMGCQMGVHTGWMVNQIDLAPNYTGAVMTIGNSMATFFIQLMPFMISNIVIDVRNLIQWRICFGIVAAWTLVGNAVFVIMMSAEKQPWNDYADISTDEEKNEHENNVIVKK
ncbi:putative inorganic phosphate cotransporter isoform X2 [Bombyx mori]|uniref:Major facilitator superfamily (MFS) profile domain-containing protein n=1 Tax=Bombyx mori TaxID=7091 RepID=A0A8R2LXN7_BOMMO|nr:putative inorganic phosphate cotransporter isoform X2 [Bombyx mori]